MSNVSNAADDLCGNMSVGFDLESDLTPHRILTKNLIRHNDYKLLADAREAYGACGYAALPGFLEKPAVVTLTDELTRLREKAMRKDFSMPGYESPRNMAVLSGRQISRESPLIFSLYFHHAIRDMIAEITQSSVYSCSHEGEFLVANMLEQPGDTHGWHIDDPAFALVICLKSAPADAGGEVQFIPDWVDLCASHRRSPSENIDDLVTECHASGLVKTDQLEAGDAYLLNAGDNLHRVMPLTRSGVSRWVVNLGFQSVPYQTYGTTADALYS
ncbi:hypothetical protein QTO30_20410 [Yoonia sp. GPGPB17]|uniref:HalD/BesD family halogenase n=1 Tax=Yoonia sp. GPGPB17 TaxID=3026147 RepID=UPI0030BF24E2